MVLAVAWTVVVLLGSFTTAGIAICVAGFVIGGITGTVSARAVKMTAMSAGVAIFNGAGGGARGASRLAALLELFRSAAPSRLASQVLAIIIGGISFAGSVIAFLKLQELMTGCPDHLSWTAFDQWVACIDYTGAGSCLAVGE